MVQLIVNLKPAVLFIALLPQFKQISSLHEAIFFSIMLIYNFFSSTALKLMMVEKCFVYDHHACLVVSSSASHVYTSVNKTVVFSTYSLYYYFYHYMPSTAICVKEVGGKL
jgi:hypothetical protein